jgi:hypothetical protein
LSLPLLPPTPWTLAVAVAAAVVTAIVVAATNVKTQNCRHRHRPPFPLPPPLSPLPSSPLSSSPPSQLPLPLPLPPQQAWQEQMGRGRDDDAAGGNIDPIFIWIIRSNVGKGLVSVIKQVLVTTFGFTKTGFVLVLQGSPKTCPPKLFVLFFFSVTNQNCYQNSHRQSETKIAKTLLTGTKATYDEIKKKEKQVSVGCKDRHKSKILFRDNFTFYFFSLLQLRPSW